MIGKMKSRVTLKRWSTVKTSTGGVNKVLVKSVEVWARVEDRSGLLGQSQDKREWTYDSKITFRYDTGNTWQSGDTIDYDNYRYKINSLSIISEGSRMLYMARCSRSDKQIDDSSIAGIVSFWNYYGVGGESSFTANGSGMIIPNTNRDIRNKTIYGAFKDGENFEVITSGAFTPDVKQVRYTKSTGLFEWSVPYEPGEHTLIQYY